MAVALRCLYPGGYPGQQDGPRSMREHEIAEVSEADARYLCETFPGYFDRMARPATASSAAPSRAPVAGGLLASPVRDILPAIRSGEHDGEIAALVAAENAGQARATVLAALDTRARMVAAGEG